MTTHTDSKARAAINAAIVRAQKAAKVLLSAKELRSIELATLRELAKRELAAKNAAVSLAAKAKADSERIAKLQARARYERAQLVRDAVTIEYAAIFSGVTSGTDSQAYCSAVSHTVQKTVSRTVTVCETKTDNFLREIAANTVPAKTVAAANVLRSCPIRAPYAPANVLRSCPIRAPYAPANVGYHLRHYHDARATNLVALPYSMRRILAVAT